VNKERGAGFPTREKLAAADWKTSAPPPAFWTELDAVALARNYRAIQKMAGRRVRLAPVIKGDAYGHGMLRVARALAGLQPPMFVVGTPDAALLLRQNGITTPVLLVGTWLPGQLPALLRHAVTPSLFSPACARHVDAAAKRLRLREPVACHLRVDACDSGAGFAPVETPGFLETLPSLPRVRVAAVYTHLFASYTDPAATESALDVFDALFDSLPVGFRRGVFRHAANSPALLNHPRSRYDMARPGNALYGLPLPPGSRGAAAPPVLHPCLSIKGRVTLVRASAAPWRLGYHSRAHAAQRLAVVPAGASQAPWLFSSHGGIEALVRGQRARVLSSGMEYLYLDVSRIPGAQPGDEAVFLGRQDGDEITVRELMQKTNTDLTLCERLCMTV